MKTSSFIKLLALLIIMATGITTSSFSQKPEQLYQQGLIKEEGEGSLQEAIDIYNKVAENTVAERSLRAKAQLHIGICYEKLGLKQAQKAYQELIDSYPEQTEAVKLANEKLSLLLRAETVIRKEDKEFNIRQVWTGGESPRDGKISPDGRYFSFVDWGENAGDLAILELATGKIRRLTNMGDESENYEYAFKSRWSPDGKQIVYEYKGGEFVELHIIGLDGSKPRILYREEVGDARPHDWSPDGKQVLAFVGREGTNQIVLISVEDGSMRVLKILEKGWPKNMNFSPDGRCIVYDFPQKENFPERDISLLSTDRSREITMVEHPADDFVLGWAPDGENILFGSNRLGTMDLWTISVKEGKPQGSPRLVKKDIGLVFPMGFAPDGSFYYGLDITISDVYVGTLDKGREKFLVPPEKLTGDFVGRNFSPKWSPDRKSLAYISKRHPQYEYGDNSLYIVSLETGEEREAVRPQEIQIFGDVSMGICWSPDGRSILSSGYDKKKGQGIYVVDVKTGEMTTVLYGIYGETQIMFPNWSAVGKAIFFIERNWEKGISRVFRYDMKTKEKKEIYNQSPHFLSLIPSPDGKLLAFETFKKYKEENLGVLMVLPVEGGEPREVVKITSAGETCWTIAWTPDSREIIYGKDLHAIGSQGIAQESELWKVSVEGGEPQKLWKMADSLKWLSVHPDGQRLAFTSSTWRAEIWVMENFLAKEETDNK